ncbi:triphosphoribosyl-dephospho-CoA synthase [Paraburkholderia sp. ZP32-5]|uniref:triphosphoribosyl-dephospho-CoA synthase n=1 Tax=Paraburkholderia sp. ZP32-5 TaxID=2883245 RepID=UPI001F2E58A4|nr:triphosphoribosyl-dephospho-CoA synthase [Paraburkholderia sp. ZP32-5]
MAPAALLERLEPSCVSPVSTARAACGDVCSTPFADAQCSDASFADDAQLARDAVAALIDEAELTPKPALVDRRGSGAHRDLDLATMRRSAYALEPTFAALARAARRRGEPSALLRTELAQIGRAGEQQMMRATGGSNAHRGAIWIIGLLVAGVAIDMPASAPASMRISNAAARICALAARIACFPDRFAAPTDSHGERVRQRYQVGGARREAQDGFPHALDIGLPALHAARARGVDENAARVDALLAIMSTLDDTCLLHRAGLAGLHAGQRGAQRVLDAGGSSTHAGRVALDALESELLSLNASPGGAADLLAATLFLDMLAPRDAGRS